MWDYRQELPAVKPPAPRGIRNNNPGNIEKGASWVGLAGRKELTADQEGESRFAVFSSPVYGVLAIAKLMLNYQRKYGLKSVYEIISRYAPSSENNTMAYAAQVAEHVGVSAKEPVNAGNPATMRRLVEAIIRHENGMQPYPDHVIDEGISMALGGNVVSAPPPDEWVTDDAGNNLPVYYHDDTVPGSAEYPVRRTLNADTKPPVQSKIIWTQVVTALIALLAAFGLNVPQEFQDFALQLLAGGVTVSSLLTIVFRWFFTNKLIT